MEDFELTKDEKAALIRCVLVVLEGFDTADDEGHLKTVAIKMFATFGDEDKHERLGAAAPMVEELRSASAEMN